ncbi:hypothetical protein B484DRAFT_451100 [Ochromonadaceae sp. CCMP2298]|nr:hypothetical protein B484DRAFT_451100 [Ochromonadaceae sp. CCMP2298]
MSAPRHLSTIYMYQMQLFSSWFSMDEIVMQFEIGASSSRLGARVQKMHLIVADPQTPDTISQFRLWNALLRGQRYVDAGAGTAMELVRRADGHYQLTVTDLCAALIRQGSDRREEEETVNLIVAFFTYTNLAIPIATMLMHCCDHPNTQQICFLLLFLTSSTILNYTYGSLFLRLLYIAVVDVERQGHVMRTLDCLLRLNDFHIQDAQRESFEESEQIVQRRVDDIMRIGSGNNAMHVYCPLARRGCTQNGNEDRDRERDWERDREQAGRRQSRASMGGMGAGGGVGMGETLSSLHANQALPQANASTPSARAATAVPFPTAPTTAINNSGIGNSGAYVCDIGTEVDTGCETDTDRLPAGLRRRPRTSLQSELMVADHDLAVPPRLSMDWQENIMGWLHARLVLQGFGLRWRERIDMYVALNVALVLLFMAGVLAVLASTQDRTAIITSPFFLQLMLVVTTCVGFLLVFSKKAAECNNVMETHSASLGSHLLHLRERSESLRQEAAGLRYQQLHAKMKRDRQRGQGQGLRERVEAAQKGADGAGAGKGERVWTEAELEEAGAELLLKVEEELETTRSVIETLEGGVDIADRATATHPYLMFQLQAADSLTMSIATTAFSFYSVLATLLFSAEDSVLNTYAEVR